MEAGADSADGDAEEFGDVRVAHLLHVAEDDCFAIVGGECGEGEAELLDALGVGEIEQGIGLGGGNFEIEILGGGSAELLEEEVAGDAVEVTGEGAAGGVEAAGATDEGEEDLLNDVFGDFRGAGHAEGVAEDGGLMALIEGVEGVVVAGLKAAEEGELVRAVRRGQQQVSIPN
jgi:hypothetical protein